MSTRYVTPQKTEQVLAVLLNDDKATEEKGGDEI